MRPNVAYRARGNAAPSTSFAAPERWHEPAEDDELKFVTEEPGRGFIHPVTADDVAERLAEFPAEFTADLKVVQFSKLTRKRRLFPLYGMQWGAAIYLYPLEANYRERYLRTPKPQQVIEAEMYGGRWYPDNGHWVLEWTPETVRDFYLNNVLVHELGHLLDDRNTSFEKREQYAIWFATEYGYRWSRGRRPKCIGGHPR